MKWMKFSLLFLLTQQVKKCNKSCLKAQNQINVSIVPLLVGDKIPLRVLSLFILIKKKKTSINFILNFVEFILFPF